MRAGAKAAAWHTFDIEFASTAVNVRFDKGASVQLESVNPYTVTEVKLYLGVVSAGPRDVYADNVLVTP